MARGLLEDSMAAIAVRSILGPESAMAKTWLNATSRKKQRFPNTKREGNLSSHNIDLKPFSINT
jgi:hypothetical protein